MYSRTNNILFTLFIFSCNWSWGHALIATCAQSRISRRLQRDASLPQRVGWRRLECSTYNTKKVFTHKIRASKCSFESSFVVKICHKLLSLLPPVAQRWLTYPPAHAELSGYSRNWSHYFNCLIFLYFYAVCLAHSVTFLN